LLWAAGGCAGMEPGIICAGALPHLCRRSAECMHERQRAWAVLLCGPVCVTFPWLCADDAACRSFVYAVCRLGVAGGAGSGGNMVCPGGGAARAPDEARRGCVRLHMRKESFQCS